MTTTSIKRPINSLGKAQRSTSVSKLAYYASLTIVKYYQTKYIMYFIDKAHAMEQLHLNTSFIEAVT